MRCNVRVISHTSLDYIFKKKKGKQETLSCHTHTHTHYTLRAVALGAGIIAAPSAESFSRSALSHTQENAPRARSHAQFCFR